MNKLLSEKNISDDTYLVDITLEDIKIDKKEIEVLLGYKNGGTPSHFIDLIDSALADIPNIVDIKAGYKLLPVSYASAKNSGLCVGEKFFHLDKIVTGILKKSDEVALFCVTIGEGLEKHSNELILNGDLVNGFVCDIVASVTVEACTDALHDHLFKKMNLINKKCTNRYSPGYCNWNVDEQHILFSLLPPNFCGISLTESALMRPIKSVSGIIGIGNKVKYTEYSCEGCNMKDCTYRTGSGMKDQNR